ncbi:MAG: thioesterase family protein [Acidimicrobiia bacterium]|nr:thioesterase family protein [Acidimicrobiia bacterium]
MGDFEALFLPEGDGWMPTEAGLGPWGPDLLHGGAVSALAIMLMEDEAHDDYEAVRYSADFVRALPMTRMEGAVRTVRKGQRLEVLDCELTAGGRLVARCSLVRVRPQSLMLPEGAPMPSLLGEPPPDTPEAFHAAPAFDPGRTFFVGAGIEMRVPDPARFGAGVAWYRLMIPTAPGRPPSPTARAAAAADFGNGISGFRNEYIPVAFPNADLVVHLGRQPEGEWVRLQATSEWRPDGIGLARGELGDRNGGIGLSQQSLVLSAAPAR